MIRIAIADDDAAFLAKIEKYIQKYQKENGEDIQLTAFSDAKELIEGYSPVYDIVILDIEMPGMNGMEAAEKIRQADEDVVLMFITNMIQYAIRGYSVGALDFVMKPVNYYTFSLKLTRAIGRIHWRKKCPGTENSGSHGPAHLPETKTLPSSHCIPRHCTPAFHLPYPVCSSTLPDGRFHHAHRCSDKILHPCIHALNSENPSNYSLQPDIMSCPDRS